MSSAVPESWGKCILDGKDVKLFTIKAPAGGAYATLTNYGATLVSLWVPDRAGALGDVLLGHDTLVGNESHVVSMGATVGRFANRIAMGQFSLDGQKYNLVQNNGTNCLHGGEASFDNKTWDVVEHSAGSLTLAYESADMEEGFPGKLKVMVTFSMRSAASGGDCALHIHYAAETDKPTVLNLTNHAYFNLAGFSGGPQHSTVMDHIVTINAEEYLSVDDRCIPHGLAVGVASTPFDFRRPTRIGDRIDEADCQLIYANGYDHCYVLPRDGLAKDASPGAPQGMRALGVSVDASGRVQRTRAPDCVLVEQKSGRRMETFTEEPGVHFFTNNIPQDILDRGGKGKHGVKAYTYRTGCCFETQHFPDSPNQPNFPSTVLRPGSKYSSETVYWFGVEK
jgi:aldose 1-epimerase